MKAWSVIVLAALVLVGCSHKDPIDRLMAKVPYEEVPSYLFRAIMLPASASPEQCISNLTSYGELHDPKILEIRQVHTTPRPEDHIPIESFTAVLLKADGKEEIVLLQPPADKHGWYWKIYDAK